MKCSIHNPSKIIYTTFTAKDDYKIILTIVLDYTSRLSGYYIKHMQILFLLTQLHLILIKCMRAPPKQCAVERKYVL